MSAGSTSRLVLSSPDSARRAQQDAAMSPVTQDADDVLMVVVPIPHPRSCAPTAAAAKGNANAGRELRAWLAEYPPKDGAVTTEKLDRRTKERVLARILAELRDESPAQS
jgi:hypothetical protein